MKKQKKNYKYQLLLSWMILLFFGFHTPKAQAAAPKEVLAGALQIPGTTDTRDFLYKNESGDILENDGTTLQWKNGNLTLYYYKEQVLWSSDTGGKGGMLTFQSNGGELVITDMNGNVLWTTGVTGGAKLTILNNRNLVMKNSSSQIIWKTDTAMPDLEEDGFNLIGANDDVCSYDVKWYHEDYEKWDVDRVIQSGAQDFMVPVNTKYSYLYLEVEGADGGKRKTTGFTVNGGSGATMKVTYEIGTQAKQIPPGATIRFIVGKSGHSKTGQGSTGGTGGGGTAVFVKIPGDLNWHLLVAAGGGGGAHADCCTEKSKGKSAEVFVDGSGGGSDSNNGGGKNGNRGDGYADLYNYSSAGGGAFGTTDSESALNPAWMYGDKNQTRLPIGWRDRFHYDDNGGFGFGCGGHGEEGGGGGGGYSGGGSGKNHHGGGGGGSYLLREFTVHDVVRIKNTSTPDPQDGFVRYKLTNTLLNVSQTIKLASAPTDKCATNISAVVTNGNNIELVDCKSAVLSQGWLFDEYRIRLANYSLRCMDVKDHGTANGTNVRIWDCMEHNEQRWIYDGFTKQFRSFLDVNKCLNDAYGGNTANGTNIMLWDCHPGGGKADQWNIDGVTVVSNPTAVKQIVPIKGSNLALQSKTGAESGSNVELTTKSGTNANGKWVFDGLEIKMQSDPNYCIDLNRSLTINANNIQVWACNDTDAQKWAYNGKTKQIHSAIDPNKCMEVATSGTYEKGMNIQIMDCNQHSRQQFLIEE